MFGWFKWAENLKQSGVVWIMSTTGLDWFGLDTDDLVPNRFNLWTEFWIGLVWMEEVESYGLGWLQFGFETITRFKCECQPFTSLNKQQNPT